jgi:hypothetical protein
MLVMPLIAAVACSSTYRSMTNQEKKDFLVDLEKETLAELVAERPEAQTDLDSSVGCAVISNSAAKVPMVGAGEGIGVVVNTETGERTYLEVSRLDVGGGLGVRKFRLIIIFFDREELEDLADGELEIGAGAEAGAGDHDDVGTGPGGVAGARNEKRVLYQLSEAGVSATFTVWMIKYSVLELDG